MLAELAPSRSTGGPNPSPVFISWRHEPDRPEQADRVLAFADRLRAEGIDAVLDHYEVALRTS